MAAPINNKYWLNRSKSGRDKKYTPKKLWEIAIEYFEWVEANPLKESKVVASMGEAIVVELNKMRAMTMKGFCLYAGISHVTLSNYRKDEEKDFLSVVTRIEDIIYTQKFEGASANLLSSNIIARDLGLTDKKDISNSDGTLKPTIVAPDQAQTDKIEKLLKKFDDGSN